MIIAVFVLLALTLAALLWRDHRPKPQPNQKAGAVGPKSTPREILIDGSNVMWWDGDAPRIETLTAVVNLLKAQGFRPGVIFDASAGHRLFGRYRDDAVFARMLGLPVAQVLVVPKGEIADRFLLTVARERGLAIVTNDRYRDWVEAFPELTTPGRLIRGDWSGAGPRLQMPADPANR